MSRIITLNSGNFRNMRATRNSGSLDMSSKILSIMAKSARKKQYQPKGSVRIGLSQSVFALFLVSAISGAFYLYQVNDLATKGYEIKEIENQISELQKENKRMEIREVELKSMYNVEKATENLDLVSATNVSYLEINGPVAMK